MNNSSLISLSHPQVDLEDDYITPFIRKLEDQRMVFSDNLRDVQRITKAFRLVEHSEFYIDRWFLANNWQNMKKITVKAGFQRVMLIVGSLWLTSSSKRQWFGILFVAIRKLKIQEPRLGHLEFEIEEHRKELKRIDKKNRSLADNQRQLELDKRVSYIWT